jgi:hypothetical protein
MANAAAQLLDGLEVPPHVPEGHHFHLFHHEIAAPAAAAALSDHERAWAADAAARYLDAHRGDVPAARTALARTLAWRRTTIPPPPGVPSCDACGADDTAHCITCVGLTDDGRPLIYLSPPRARDLRTHSCTQHLVSELEAGFALPGAAPASVWFVDLRGFSLLQSGMNPGLGLAYVRLLSEHYPERLSQLLLVAAPGYFEWFLGALRPFIDARTAAKIVGLRTLDDARAWVAQHCDRHAGGSERGSREGGDAADDGATTTPAAAAPPTMAVGAWLRQALELHPEPGNLPPRMPDGAPPAPSVRGRNAAKRDTAPEHTATG